MKDFDNIEDWYRDELNDFNVNPDDKVWNSLSDDLDANMTLTDDNISEWYKREASKLEERPDYTVWEKLATKLDTTSVWDKLVVSLNQYDKFIWWRNTILKTSAVLLLIGGSYLAYHNYSNDISNSVISKNEGNNKSNNLKASYSNTKENPNKPSNNIKNNIAESLFSEKNPTNKLQNEKKNLKQILSNTEKKESNTTSDNNKLYASNQKEELYSSLKIKDLNNLKTENQPTIATEIERRNLTIEDISHTFSSADFLVKKEKNKIVFNSKRFSSYTSYGLYARRFYLGLNAGIKKQGLITKIKEESSLAEFNQVEYLDYGSNFGGTFGYILSDKINLESNVNLFSSSGYKKRYNGEGISYKENLNLNYGTINFLAKYMNTKSTFDNKVYSTNFITGIYASWLYAANSSINGNSSNLKSFNNTDLGIVLGIEQDRYLSKTLIITPGIRYNQGLTNIANSSNQYESARNYSLEFNIGLKYIFLKTSK
ncbi:MAG: hypothetical protein P1U41_04885 [Vicingaceae bacterium]|nr:hypothetical protein [Vicingaceae bacterium]